MEPRMSGRTIYPIGILDNNSSVTHFRRDYLSQQLSLDNKDYNIEQLKAEGGIKKIYTTQDEEYLYGTYTNVSENNGLKLQKDLRDIEEGNEKYIPDIKEIGQEYTGEYTKDNFEYKNNYVIMEKVEGIDFADLVKFVLRCCIYIEKNKAIRFKTQEELDEYLVKYGITPDTKYKFFYKVGYNFFIEVILQPLNKRIQILKYLFQELLKAVSILHNFGLLHLDIKMENMMIVYDDKETEETEEYKKFKVKIIDFGFCSKMGGYENKNPGAPFINRKILTRLLLSNEKQFKFIIEIICNFDKTKISNFEENLLTFNAKKKLVNESNSFKDDIYPLGLMFQGLFVICILNANEFNYYFNKSGDLNIEEDYITLNLEHIIGLFDHIRYIYKNIVELYLLSSDSSTQQGNLEKLELFREFSFQNFKNLKIYLGDKNFKSDTDAHTFNKLLDEINIFYNRASSADSSEDSGTPSIKKELYDKIKELIAKPETITMCRQCFLLLNIITNMIGSGISEYQNIDQIFDELKKLDNSTTLEANEKKALTFVCNIDKIDITNGGSSQVGGLIFKRKAPGNTNKQSISSIEEKFINFNSIETEYHIQANRLFQKHFNSHFKIDDYLHDNKIFIKPISRIYYKTEKLPKVPRVIKPSRKPLENEKADLYKPLGLIDREVCYQILNDEDNTLELKTQLKEAFGFKETKVDSKKFGGFRKKRKSSKNKTRKSSKFNKRYKSISKTNSTPNKKNKNYKQNSKRKKHLKVKKTKITRKKNK